MFVNSPCWEANVGVCLLVEHVSTGGGTGGLGRRELVKQERGVRYKRRPKPEERPNTETTREEEGEEEEEVEQRRGNKAQEKVAEKGRIADSSKDNDDFKRGDFCNEPRIRVPCKRVAAKGLKSGAHRCLRAEESRRKCRLQHPGRGQLRKLLLHVPGSGSDSSLRESVTSLNIRRRRDPRPTALNMYQGHLQVSRSKLTHLCMHHSPTAFPTTHQTRVRDQGIHLDFPF